MVLHCAPSISFTVTVGALLHVRTGCFLLRLRDRDMFRISISE